MLMFIEIVMRYTKKVTLGLIGEHLKQKQKSVDYTELINYLLKVTI